jgi:Fic family protein
MPAPYATHPSAHPSAHCPLTVDSIHRLNATAQSALLAIQRAGRMASARIIDAPGVYRRTAISIRHANHTPPPPQTVDAHMRALLAHLQSAWTQQDAAWLSGLALWRINWIHPYREGNGRTARAACRTIVLAHQPPTDAPAFARALDHALIADRPAYYAALHRADAAYIAEATLDAAAHAMRGFVDGCISSAAAAR